MSSPLTNAWCTYIYIHILKSGPEINIGFSYRPTWWGQMVYRRRKQWRFIIILYWQPVTDIKCYALKCFWEAVHDALYTQSCQVFTNLLRQHAGAIHAFNSDTCHVICGSPDEARENNFSERCPAFRASEINIVNVTTAAPLVLALVEVSLYVILV